MKKFRILILLLAIQLPIFAQGNVKIEILNGTFLGGEGRNYYGNRAPEKLDIIWKAKLGQGETVISSRGGSRIWKGCGWTGQPLLVKENDTLYVIQGAFDHNLKKFNAETGKKIWDYKYDDVIKGSGAIWYDSTETDPEKRAIIMQGSRLGTMNTTHTPIIPSFRGISLLNGKEQWRLNVKKTRSYSRDVDGSAVIYNNKAYIALENSTFVRFNPHPDAAKIRQGIKQPILEIEHKLYEKKDVIKHGGNLVAESSAARIGNRFYIASGSGHVYGYNIDKDTLDWDFFVGSDMDGSTVVTSDSCIIVSVEKQYIEGKGGAFKLDPSKPADSSCVVWWFPVEDDSVSTWAGGIIGSAAVNDLTKPDDFPNLAAFQAIDGNCYIVKHMEIDTDSSHVFGPNLKHKYPRPKLFAKKLIGASIATPLLVGDKLVTTGYAGIRLYKYNKTGDLKLLDKFVRSAFESTPVVHNGRLYIGGRTGWLYCLGTINNN